MQSENRGILYKCEKTSPATHLFVKQPAKNQPMCDQ